ncbi:MAG: phosphatidylinositol mannoside acyltransferase [Dactylosporangium sp.]|nr:phosphatidylinositol mannoside acyltransferase [Dactylosporangium sp.]NNJ60110.1 phosphatidylinositol mannoside acyltransferase [Dactylosporangium sp.]
MSRLADRLTELGYATGWRTVRLLPHQIASAGFSAGADLATRRRGPGVRRLADNLRTVVGDGMPEREFQRLLRAGVRSYARYWLELFRLPDRSSDQILRGFRLDGIELLEAAIAQGRGVVLALPHMANWDAAGAWAAAKGWPITTVAERLKPEAVYERFLACRRRLGMEILPLTGGDRSVLAALSDRLGRGHIVPLVADREFSAGGVEVTFFGGIARMPPGPALLALRTGAPLMTASLWYERDVVCGRVEPPLSMPETGPVSDRARLLTQRVADNFAAGIAAHPADWHMMQPVWSRQPARRSG